MTDNLAVLDAPVTSTAQPAAGALTGRVALQDEWVLPALPDLDLPEEDGIPMESSWHVANMNLLIDVLRYHLRDRSDYFCAGNMFIYFSLEQAEQVIKEVEQGLLPYPPERRAYRGPDFFVVLDVDGVRRRKYWAVWEEEGRYPNVIVELQSPSTARHDERGKKALYEQVFRTPEYFCVNPVKGEIKGWRLTDSRYQPLQPDSEGRLWSDELGLWLGWWQGAYQEREDQWPWARFFDQDGTVVPIRAEAEAQRAEAEAQRAEAEAQRAEAEAQRARAAEAQAARLRAALLEAGVDPDSLGIHDNGEQPE